ncbi:MAG: sensor histidine kinase [Dehalococcoidales bacterium]|nr:sensor histidine kinase [Dehalococcoidales bacterium]
MPLLRDIQLKDEFRSELLREIFSIQEEERRRIARELHDETSQALASLNANLEAALGMLPGDADKVRARLKEAQMISISILDEIHKIIYELRPSLLDDLGLGPAVRWLAEVNLETAGIKVDFKATGKERRLPPQLETTLFRITKEAFSNITRHAHARNVSLDLHFRKNSVKVRIQDDGTGFDVEEAINSKERPRGLGLLGMKERVELMNGMLNIYSRPGDGGTVIDIEIPLKQEVVGGENKDTGRG